MSRSFWNNDQKDRVFLLGARLNEIILLRKAAIEALSDILINLPPQPPPQSLRDSLDASRIVRHTAPTLKNLTNPKIVCSGDICEEVTTLPFWNCSGLKQAYIYIGGGVVHDNGSHRWHGYLRDVVNGQIWKKGRSIEDHFEYLKRVYPHHLIEEADPGTPCARPLAEKKPCTKIYSQEIFIPYNAVAVTAPSAKGIQSVDWTRERRFRTERRVKMVAEELQRDAIHRVYTREI
ncbi:uncharacterized protein BT62DRAFT_922955 [Guyanagaster necrorhizus]|uniref:Uncharacterized protein n=1 Tax=Guyanagaster necrorhizus TaxID=856835 RepID=A0A9P7VKB8_9AGAR|nr:uncharacterized protein BT62DRAFT_922955 [Guyanagaster necrorhizus MCA 3950]KAG7441930.1 hypothetical protein BT62DRAFT_922955 [Guyanagaster necrorhizus MCA 3950]